MAISTWAPKDSYPKEIEYAPTELKFHSDIFNADYRASQIAEIAEDVLRSLMSEASELLASLKTTKEDAEQRIAIGEVIELTWLRRVRYRYNKLAAFKGLLFRELDARTDPEGRSLSIRQEKNKASRAIKREKQRMETQIAHQQSQREYSYHMRKFFYELVKEHVGEMVFNAMVERSKEMAEEVAPRP